MDLSRVRTFAVSSILSHFPNLGKLFLHSPLDAKSGETTQVTRISSVIQYVLPTVIQKRRQIAMLPDLDITTIQQKERLLKEADQALEIVKLGADMLIGI